MYYCDELEHTDKSVSLSKKKKYRSVSVVNGTGRGTKDHVVGEERTVGRGGGGRRSVINWPAESV